MLNTIIILLGIITGMQEFRATADVPAMTTNKALETIASAGAMNPTNIGPFVLSALSAAKEPFDSFAYIAVDTSKTTDPFGDIVGSKAIRSMLTRKAMCRYGISTYKKVVFVILTCQSPNALHKA